MFGGHGQMALNQLLVTMDGIDNPPFWRRFWTNRFNNLLDASYVVPRRLRNMPLRFPPARPAGNQIYFIGATNVPLQSLDPAIQRPGRMGRHVWFRTPTKHDREDIFELYLGKVSHDPELDTARARDELARITNGYSPAMVEQVCSMALTRAHHEGRLEFTRDDIIEAMTTVESGTAVGVEYVPEETRAVAIHEAGHAATAHVFMKGVESTRISIKMRAGSLGHHQALEKEERFSSWKHEEMGKLAWTLGALAAEHVFYGENATGVGGDLQSATGRAAWMVGVSGMGPDKVELNGKARTQAKKDEEREKVEKRFEEIGLQLMNRASGDFQHDAIASVLGDPTKRRLAAQIIGQAYVKLTTSSSRTSEGVEKIADTARRQARALRRRARRPAQLGGAQGADRRPDQGGSVADAVSEQQPLTKREEQALVIARRTGRGEGPAPPLRDRVPPARRAARRGCRAVRRLRVRQRQERRPAVVGVEADAERGAAVRPDREERRRRVRATERPPARRGALDAAGRPGAEHPGSAAGDRGADGARRRDLQ